MTKTLRISVADDEPEMREYFEKILTHMGHQVLSVAANGRELVDHCHQLQPDLVITDIKMPIMDGIEASTAISLERAIPIILVSAHHDQQLIERAEEDHIAAYLIKPIKQADLQTAIAIAIRRFEQFMALRDEADNLRQALEDRKIIERAKGHLMRKAGLDEQDAFRRLQKLSNEKNKKLVDVAQSILLAMEALEH